MSCFLFWGCCSEEPKPEDTPVEEAAAEEAAAEPEAPVEEEKVRSRSSWELVHCGVWICTVHNATATNGLARLKRACGCIWQAAMLPPEISRSMRP